VVDAALDLLLDGATGRHELRAPSLPEVSFVRILAEAADTDPALVHGQDDTHQASAETRSTTLLPPPESTAERFVRERRLVRKRLQAASPDRLKKLHAAK
jgi:hypothetical protein